MMKLMITFKYQDSHNLNQSQSGFAAFTVTLILAIVITLIVLGFAANSRDEQTRALNAQLNTAAYYAAESGINDAYSIISYDFNHNVIPIPPEPTCTGPYLTAPSAIPSTGTLTQGSTTSSGAAAYTCLIVNPTPSSLVYSPIDSEHGQVIPVMTTGASPLESITISWQEDGIQILNFSDCPTPSSVNTSSSTYVSTLQNDFSSEANWNANASCTAGVLQVDMAPSAGWSTVGQLQQASYSVFLAPATNSVDTTPQPVVNAEIYPSVCGSGSGGIYACTVTLTLPPPNNQTGYYLRVTPIYSDADVSITATSTTGQQVTLTGGQVEIDSTGKAGDNLKRIQERISANPVSNSDAPVPALQGLNGICKEFYTRPGVSTNAPGVNC